MHDRITSVGFVTAFTTSCVRRHVGTARSRRCLGTQTWRAMRRDLARSTRVRSRTASRRDHSENAWLQGISRSSWCTLGAAMDLLRNGPNGASTQIVLAHGAGAGMDSPFMQTIAEGLAARGFGVVRFEFPYMREKRRGGAKRGPDRQDVLVTAWRTVIAEIGGAHALVLGGKSLGGRIASLIADEVGAKGLVCLGYPFHPPGRPRVLRTRHLERLNTPTLIVQGTRDSMGSKDEVPDYTLSPRIHVSWIEDGDHSLKPRRRSGSDPQQALATAVEEVASFVGTL
jgi:predicted alpha/beta-hydrolase family hydrolase